MIGSVTLMLSSIFYDIIEIYYRFELTVVGNGATLSDPLVSVNIFSFCKQYLKVRRRSLNLFSVSDCVCVCIKRGRDGDCYEILTVAS